MILLLVSIPQHVSSWWDLFYCFIYTLVIWPSQCDLLLFWWIWSSLKRQEGPVCVTATWHHTEMLQWKQTTTSSQRAQRHMVAKLSCSSESCHILTYLVEIMAKKAKLCNFCGFDWWSCTGWCRHIYIIVDFVSLKIQWTVMSLLICSRQMKQTWPVSKVKNELSHSCVSLCRLTSQAAGPQEGSVSNSQTTSKNQSKLIGEFTWFHQ